MSRMAIVVLLSIAGTSAHATQSLETTADMIARYGELTRGDPDCRRAQTGDEIVVCGRRDADRYRVPLVEPEAGDRRVESVAAERERYQYKRTPCQNYELFLVGCGMVGVSVGIDGSGRVQYRKLAD